MATFDSSAPGPSRLTPDNTPEARYHEPPSYLEQFTYPEQLPYAEAFHPNHPELASPIPVAGKGIQFPPSHNPLPIELTQATPELPKHSLTNDHTSFPSSISHSKSETTSPNPTHPSYLPYHGPPRPRSTSPRPPALQLSQGFASSSSLGHGGDQQHRERVVSPTFRSTPTQSTPIDLNSSGEFDRRSPAMDGKKEPPIKSYPILPYNPDSFDGRRSVYPTQSHHYAYGYQNHPLSGNGMGNYTEKGREVGPVKGEKERFIESTGCWLGLYFCFNLGLTLFNKVVLTSFPFPYVSPSAPGHGGEC